VTASATVSPGLVLPRGFVEGTLREDETSRIAETLLAADVDVGHPSWHTVHRYVTGKGSGVG
jgi:hypothetical protein